MTSPYTLLMFDQRLEQALRERRQARHKLRIGEFADFKEHMHGARFYLRLAREWKPKHIETKQLEAAE